MNNSVQEPLRYLGRIGQALALLCGLILAQGVFAQLAAPAKPEPPATLAELQERITAHLSRTNFASAFWGVKVVSLDTGKTLFETNAQKLFTPASNTKLYTVALALDRLGPDYRIKTSLYAKSRPDAAGTLAGDLMVYGRGDPVINARLHGGDVFKALDPLASALTNAGVRRVAGDLVGDASFLRGPEFGSGWQWDDQEYPYGAEISALTINDNTLQLSVKPAADPGLPGRLLVSPSPSFLVLSNRTWTVAKDAARSIRVYRVPGENLTYVSGQMPVENHGYLTDVTLHNPAALFVTLFKEALARRGIAVDGQVRTSTWLDRQADSIEWDQWIELGACESPPVRDLAREVLKPSQNLYADLLLAQVGEKRRVADTPADRTSEALGIRELNQFLSQAGVRRGDVQFNEGSGLSRDNLTTPNATAALLRFMSHHPAGAIYAEALPVAGVDGTLEDRMKATAATGNLRAKTGTLRWANSLSGYVTTAAGEHLAFSLMLNRYFNTDPERPARAELDAIAIMLAELKGRSSSE
jgi:D-alanyl-D-alanine carboxypeptidase/D-alanyl-D-alanine-endopeptidase (penicillin-binding protein 4)